MCGPSNKLDETPAETFLRVTGHELSSGCSYSQIARVLFKAFDIKDIYTDEADNELQLNLLALPV